MLAILIVRLYGKALQRTPAGRNIAVGAENPIRRTPLQAPRVGAEALPETLKPLAACTRPLYVFRRQFLGRSHHAPDDDHIVQPGRFSEMRLNKIGHVFEPRICQIESPLAAYCVEVSWTLESRACESREHWEGD